MSPRREQGYALVAAVTAVAAFAYIAFQVLASDQGGIATTSGRMRQARLEAAADAGLNLAIHGLAADDRGSRWAIDGRPRQVEFDGVDLTVTVEDEQGKAPLSKLTDAQARALFAGAGATGDRLESLVTEFRSRQTEDNPLPEPLGVDPVGSATASAPPAPAIRHGPIRTIGELAVLKDMDPAIFARIAPSVTMFFEDSGGFDLSYAQPLAKAAMSADSLANPEQLENEALIDGQRTAEKLAPEEQYIGRPLTISVVARGRDGAQTHRMEIIEMTGDKAQPFWVRYAE